MSFPESLYVYWDALYPGRNYDLLDRFIEEVKRFKTDHQLEPLPGQWYKEVVVYSLYVDLFNRDIQGLTEKLPYLKGLGVSCLWLLPVLESPMRDAGFDISNYRKIRSDLTGADTQSARSESVFSEFLNKAHDIGIRVIFDIAINHTSDEHSWFQDARSSKQSKYRDYYIWSADNRKYSDARIIFEGLCDSNWEKSGDEYYFHRFFEFQPDLNYRNPEVLFEMARNFMFWLEKGIDGFRADAIPYLWKEEGTSCENLPNTHMIVKFFRAVLEYARPGTLLLAEACQKPYEVVKYFGDGDECNAGYHFPLMPQIFKALAMEKAQPITHTLSREVTPEIPANAQWFTFLRCHDELSLELVYVSEEDRKYIHDAYCTLAEWDFRRGQGISARLSELMDRDPRKIGLIYSVMLTLPGTPVIYYGDEFGKLNDREYYEEMIKHTGKDDTRFLVRGKVDWHNLEKDLKDPDTLSYKVFRQISKMVKTRNLYSCFGKGNIHWLETKNTDESVNPSVLMYIREYDDEKLLVINNLSSLSHTIKLPFPLDDHHEDLLKSQLWNRTEIANISPYSYFWIDLTGTDNK